MGGGRLKVRRRMGRKLWPSGTRPPQIIAKTCSLMGFQEQQPCITSTIIKNGSMVVMFANQHTGYPYLHRQQHPRREGECNAGLVFDKGWRCFLHGFIPASL